MKKAYVVNLSFGIWKNQLWFMGEDENQTAFDNVKKTLKSIGAGCANPNDFFQRVCAHFESHGFLRIQK